MAAISWEERKLWAIGKTFAQELEELVELGERRRRRMSWEMEESKARSVDDSIFSWAFDFDVLGNRGIESLGDEIQKPHHLASWKLLLGHVREEIQNSILGFFF